MTAPPMPAPWRTFVADVASIQTDSPLYARLKDAYLGRRANELPTEAVDEWQADQDTGQLVITCSDGSIVRAGYDILGTHDGSDFLWADANEAVLKGQTATRARSFLRVPAEPLAAPDRLPLGLRDVTALLATSCAALGARHYFLAGSRRTTIAMILGDLTITPAEPAESEAPEEKAPGLLSRLFGRKKAEPARAEQRSPLRVMQQMIDAQVHANALPAEKLIAFDALCTEIHADHSAGRFDAALARIARGKKELGRFFIDQEPAGWLVYCEGACLLAKGERAAAHEAFENAARALVPPMRSLVRLGLARSASTAASRRSCLCGLYLDSPPFFSEHATDEEAAIVRAAQAETDAARASVADDPEAVLRASLAERYAQEKRAHELSQQAEKQRKESHVMCDADLVARDTINSEYRALLMTWFDAPREASMGSWSSHPGENPAELRSLRSRERSASVAVFEAQFATPHGSEQRFRYKLVRAGTPLSERPMWRITEVWSVWPHEDIRLH